PKPNPFQGMTSTTPAEVQTMPVRSMPNTPAGSATGLPRVEDLPKGTPSLFSNFVSKFQTPETPPTESSLIINPNSPEAMPKSVKGSYWSFTKEALLDKVKDGDRDAAQIYRNRFGSLPENYRYLTDIASAKTRGLYRSGEE